MYTGFFPPNALIFGGFDAHTQSITRPTVPVRVIHSYDTPEGRVGSRTVTHHQRPGHGHLPGARPDEAGSRIKSELIHVDKTEVNGHRFNNGIFNSIGTISGSWIVNSVGPLWGNALF